MTATLTKNWQEIGSTSWGGIQTITVFARAEEDIANNRSTVYTLLRVSCTQAISCSSWSAGLDGHTGMSGGYTTWQAGDTDLISGSFVYNHSDDGSAICAIHAAFNSTYGVSGWNPAWNVFLQTIPRASQPSLDKSTIECDGTNSFVISTNRASSSFTHKLSWVFGSKSGSIPSDGSMVGTSTTWAPPTDLLAEFTDASSKTGDIYCETYSGTTKIGSAKSVKFTLTAKTYVPTLSATVTEENTKVGSVDYTVIGISNKLVTATVSALMSATITSVVVNVSGTDYSLSKQTDGTYTVTLSAVQSGTYKITVTDSRGLTTTQTITQTEYKYFAPYATSITLTRDTPTSSTGKLSAAGKWFSEASNTLTATTTVRNTSESTPTTISATLTKNGDSWTVEASNSVMTMLTYTDAFEVIITLTDGFGTSIQVKVNLSSAQYALAVGKETVKIKGNLIIKDKDDGNNGKFILNEMDVGSDLSSALSAIPTKDTNTLPTASVLPNNYSGKLAASINGINIEVLVATVNYTNGSIMYGSVTFAKTYTHVPIVIPVMSAMNYSGNYLDWVAKVNEISLTSAAIAIESTRSGTIGAGTAVNVPCLVIGW